jgi:hypothetical protein
MSPRRAHLSFSRSSVEEILIAMIGRKQDMRAEPSAFVTGVK